MRKGDEEAAGEDEHSARENHVNDARVARVAEYGCC